MNAICRCLVAPTKVVRTINPVVCNNLIMVSMWVGENWLAPTGGHGCPFPKPPPPLLARRDGAVTTGIHSPPVPPPLPPTVVVFMSGQKSQVKKGVEPEGRGQEGGGGPGGEGRRGTYRFLFFKPHPALLDPLGAWASSPPPPVGQEGETCLPRHPAIRQHLFNSERMVRQKRKNKICKVVLSVAPCV